MLDDAPDYDVIVIGAGPAGSSAAAALADRGHRVLLVERERFPRHKVCGEFLSPEAQGTLAALGLYPALAQLEPVHLRHVEVYAAQGQALRRPLPGTAWGISRYALDAALAQAAVDRGVTLCTGTTAIRTTVIPNTTTQKIEPQTLQRVCYVVALRSEGRQHSVCARMVLAAAGRQSRAALYPGPPPNEQRQQQQARHARLTRSVGVKRHYSGLSMPCQVALFLFEGGYAGINPVEGGRANLCLLVEEETFRAVGGTVEGMIAAAAAANEALGEQLAGAHPLEETTCTVAAVNTESPACPWQGLPRLGDAAVMLPPFCGDGMAMALRGAQLCVDGADAYLRGDCTLDEWAAHYTAAWRAEFAPRVRLARRLQRLLMMPHVAGGLLALGRHLPWAADYFVRATRGPVPASASSSSLPSSSLSTG